MLKVKQNPTIYVQNRKTIAKDRVWIGYWFVIMILLPLEQYTFPYNLRVSDASLFALVTFGILAALTQHRHIFFPLIGPVWLILIASLIATIGGLSTSESLMAILQEVYLFMCFLVLTNILITVTHPTMETLLRIWVVVALAEALTVILSMFQIGPSMFYLMPNGRISMLADLNRGVGTFANSNAAAAYLSISFFILLATSWPHWIRTLFAIWLLAGIFATGSMGGFLTTVGGLAVLIGFQQFLQYQRATLFAVSSIVAGVLVLALLVIVLGESQTSLSGITKETQLISLTLGRVPRALTSRITLIENAWPVYVHYPFGTGPNTTEVYLGSLHNDYVAFLFERGPFGLLGWLWLVGATFLACLRAVRRETDSFRRWRMSAFGAGFLAIAVNALSHEVSHFRQVWIFLAFLFAFSYSIIYLHKVERFR